MPSGDDLVAGKRPAASAAVGICEIHESRTRHETADCSLVHMDLAPGDILCASIAPMEVLEQTTEDANSRWRSITPWSRSQNSKIGRALSSGYSAFET